jgi:phospholipid N-methyltransferase
MKNGKPFYGLVNGRFAFLREFIKHPLQIGSIIPSSRFLERSVIEAAEVHSARTIVELGPGTGGTTKAILRAMTPQARLLSIEINPRLHALTSHIQDSRYIAHLGSAEQLPEILATYGLDSPEVLISGIPFSTMSHATGSQILAAITEALVPGGRFVAYQVSSRVVSVSRPFLGPGRQVDNQLLNIPPMRVWRWEKGSAERTVRPA